MGFSQMLDVCIGLMFMYLMLSLICTTINEIISTLRDIRAKDLKATLTSLLDDKEIHKAFYDNGLIRSLGASSRAGAARFLGWWPALAKADHPSYIEPTTFATALIASLRQDGVTGATTLAHVRAYLADRKAAAPDTDKKIVGILTTYLDQGVKDIDDLHAELTSLFDHSMDRLSGEFKRRSATVSLVVGMVVATALNADSFAVGQALWKDGDLRKSVLEAAAAQMAKDDTVARVTAARATAGTLGGTAPVSGALTDTTPAKGADAATKPDSAAAVDATVPIKARMSELVSEEEALRPLPIGGLLDSLGKIFAAQSCLDGIAAGFTKLFGLLWTALALSLGAPFWFDTLQRFMSVRNTGRKPDETTAPPTVAKA